MSSGLAICTVCTILFIVSARSFADIPIASHDIHTMDQVQSMDPETAQKLVDAARSNQMKNADALAADLESRTWKVMTMIDLDASAHHGELAGLKWSSAFAPPAHGDAVKEKDDSGRLPLAAVVANQAPLEVVQLLLDAHGDADG
jgi:hypothetical protein